MEQNAAPHIWRPSRLADGSPTYVCAICQRWYDDALHEQAQIDSSGAES